MVSNRNLQTSSGFFSDAFAVSFREGPAVVSAIKKTQASHIPTAAVPCGSLTLSHYRSSGSAVAPFGAKKTSTPKPHPIISPYRVYIYIIYIYLAVFNTGEKVILIDM